MGDLKSDLSRDHELIETHISWVFRGADTVLKVKKPVNLGFLDFSTREARRLACEQEVLLNRRLSHGVYRGVVPITLGPDGIHRVAGAGEVVDHAVRMARLDDADRADLRLREGRLSRSDLQRIARRLAGFHHGAERSARIDAFGAVERIRDNVLENFEQARALSTRFIEPQQEREIERTQLDFLERQQPLFRQRVRDGRIRDGHGDLRLEHIYLSNERLDIIDCIEFNERFRYADVCADLAFLAMDLVHQGRSDYAEDLLAAYAQCRGDYDLYALVDFYEGYRAYVRAKVASILANDESAGAAARQAAERGARSYYLHALSAQRAPLTQPLLVAVGGLIASGKSFTSERLAELLHCAAVDADRTRKHLAGVAFEDKLPGDAFAGAYTPEFSARVYAEVLRRAGVVLQSGRPVIVDASFRSAADRLAARELARRCRVPFRFIECSVPREVAMERLRERAKSRSVSDGRAEIYDDFAARWEPVTELTADEWLQLDTGTGSAVFNAALRDWFPDQNP
jgi:hypothetical protein